jgi:hypothetical protein
VPAYEADELAKNILGSLDETELLAFVPNEGTGFPILSILLHPKGDDNMLDVGYFALQSIFSGQTDVAWPTKGEIIKAKCLGVATVIEGWIVKSFVGVILGPLT